MRVFRWLSILGAPLLAVMVVAAGSSTVIGAGGATLTWSCPAPTSFASTVTPSQRGSAIAANVKLATKLDGRGAVSGRTLSLTTSAAPVTVALAGESFASDPVSNVVVFGQAAAGGGSAVGAIDLQTGCQFQLYSSAEIVRNAVIDRRLQTLFIHSVSSARADLGISQVEIATGKSKLIVPPLPGSDLFGPTFATLLHWSARGDALAVQSCGIAACRTRVLNIATAAIESYADTPLGEIVSLDDASMRALRACGTWPCDVITIDRHMDRGAQP